MLLNIPVVLQKKEHDCGEAVIEATFQFFNIKYKLHKLSNPIQGMSPDTVEAILRAARLDVLSGKMLIEDLKHFTSNHRPVLCPITTEDGGHWVIVRGVERNKVYYHCPADGYKSISIKEWLSNWKDISYTSQIFNQWGIAVSGNEE